MAKRRTRSDGPVPISSSLEQVAARIPRANLVGFAAVEQHWADVVDDAIGAHARPLSLKGTTLVVAVDQPVWATQVRLKGGQIVEQLRGKIETPITGLEVVVRST